MESNSSQCKYCSEVHDDINLQRLKCSVCETHVHSKCIRRGAVPGSLTGDIFFTFICTYCSTDGSEQFMREKMSWLQVVSLVLYHLQHRFQGLSRKGFFHWKTHLVSFISRNWAVLFRKDVRPKKNWTGTIAGILSHYSPQFFTSGTSILNEQGWWTLTYPKFSPTLISVLNSEMLAEKHKYKGTNIQINEISILKSILETKPYVTEQMLNTTSNNVNLLLPTKQSEIKREGFLLQFNEQYKCSYPKKNPEFIPKKQKSLLPTIENINKVHTKKFKRRKKRNYASMKLVKIDQTKKNVAEQIINNRPVKPITEMQTEEITQAAVSDEQISKSTQFLDHQHYYNTFMHDLSTIQHSSMKSRLIGQIQKQPLISQYSYISLPPFIWQSTSINPPWLQLMDEIKAHHYWKNGVKCTLNGRSTLDFLYFQPEHVATVNSLCAHYFWTGIDLSDALNYPDYTCVVAYKKLIVAFAIVVPNVTSIENYVSFIFTRPEWRNCGIAKYMLYFVIQASGNQDLTLHVSISNPALCLYQKFGFKVERVVLDFYDKFVQENCKDSKHAFFCRLER